MQTLVSVVIPVYNRQSTIKRAIDSVLQQTYSNLELIIVDDGSTDDTVRIVKDCHDERIKLISQRERGGANKARNIGIANSKGEYIAFQDSDDEWLPNKLRSQIDLMEREKLQACYCAYNLIEKERGIIPIPPDYRDTDKYQDHLKEILRCHNVIGTPTLVIKRELLRQLGTQYFDENIFRLQDYDFVIRIIKVAGIGYVNRTLVNVYRVAGSINADHRAFYDAAVKMLDKHRDFLDIGQYLKMITESNAIFAPSEVLIQGLDKLQRSVGRQDIDCKNLMLTRMSDLIDFQQQLLFRQNNTMIDRLEDRKFSIYGAGEFGQELYRKLKAKGVCPVCFLVTECDKGEYIDDIPIISIDEYANRDDMVIVGIAEKHQLELIDNLIQRNYKQFCVYRR